jgi:hypothetical protein
MAQVGLFGDPDSVERLADVLLGHSQDGVTTVVMDVRDEVRRIVAGLVPDDWSGQAADAFVHSLTEQDVRDLLTLAEAAHNLGSLLIPLALGIRAANQRAGNAHAIANAAGFDIDTNGNLSGDLLHTIEQLVNMVDQSALTAATVEMLAARRIADDAWNVARHALAAVHVPTVGHDTVGQAEAWASSYAVPPPYHPAPGRGKTATGLPPATRRGYFYAEAQRTEGIRLVRERCAEIVRVARRYCVPPEAIAGAILWEALENPYLVPGQAVIDPGPGPGKVHYVNNDGTTTAAQQAEDDGLLPKADSPDDRYRRVVNPDWSISYIGAILKDTADRYESGTAKRGKAKRGKAIDISTDIGVLLTFYEGVDGGPDAAAAKDDLSVGPVMANDMGPWVVDHLPWVREQLPCMGEG